MRKNVSYKEGISVKKVEFLYKNQISRRMVKVTLRNKTVIHIVSCHESWEQYGGTTEELWQTVDIADACNDWLHGGDLPESLPIE